MRRRDLDKNPRAYGDKREREVSKKGGYTHTPGSGSSSIKGDLRRGNFMIEVKSTKHDSFRVTADIMGKLHNDGLTNGKPGALIVQLGNGGQYVILPLSIFEALTDGD